MKNTWKTRTTTARKTNKTNKTTRGTTNYKTNRTTATKNRNTTTTSKTTTRTTAGKTTRPCSAQYKTNFNTFANKLNSYKTLYNQTFGQATGKRPTPATLNTFANWVNKGANVFTISKTQLNKWANKTQKTQFNFNNTTHCKNFLANKFGKTTIKAVTPAKNGNYLVACAPTCKGKPFQFPH